MTPPPIHGSQCSLLQTSKTGVQASLEQPVHLTRDSAVKHEAHSTLAD